MHSDYILNVLETVKFVFCLQTHARAECTMNKKFCILHEAARAESLTLKYLTLHHVRAACAD